MCHNSSANKWIGYVVMFGFLTLMHHYVVKPAYHVGHAVVHVAKKVII